MGLRDWLESDGSPANWQGICLRCNVRLKVSCADVFERHLGSYLRECYLSRTILHAALERSKLEHDLDICLDKHLPKTKRIRNMAFGEALTVLFFREVDLWVPLDKLGLDPNPESTTKGIDVLAFHFVDGSKSRLDRMYVFEVKTTGSRGYVKRSIAKKGGIVELFNSKLAEREMINDEINCILKELERKDEKSPFVSRLLELYEIPLQQRKQQERYCPLFVLDSQLQVEDHLSLLEQITHPCEHTVLYLIRVGGLTNVVDSTFGEAATLDRALAGQTL